MRAPYYRLLYLVAASLSLPLAGCGSSPAANQVMMADATKVAVDQPKSVAPEPEEGIDTESTIFTWVGVAKRPSQLRNGPHVGAAVSPSVWLAAHDTLKFVQIASEDPASGLIITDWYTPPNRSDERLRVNVLITSYALRSDSFKASVEREVRGRDGKWTPSTVDSKTVADLDNAILLRARQIHAETYRNTVLAQ